MTQKTILWMCVFLLSTSLIYSEDSWSATNKNYEERINKLEKQLKKLARKSTKRNRAINSKFKKAQARLKFNGFVSAGLSRSDEAADSIIGVSDQNNYLVDTIFGLQVNAKINDKTSAVLQLVGRGIDANNVLAEWGYLSHAFTPNVTVRIGRLRVPFYVASEYIEVGYAYPWVRPPIDVYTLVPITSYYGTDITMKFSFSDWSGSIQTFNGADVVDIPGVATVDIAQMYGVYLNLDRGSFSFRIGNTVAKLAMDELPNLAPPAAVLVSPDYLDFVANVIPLVPVLAPGLDISLDTDAEKYQGFLVYQLFLLNPTTFQGDFVAAADFLQTELNLDGFKVEFQDIGFGYDDGKRLARAEAVKFFIPGEYLTVHAHYLTIGQRFNEFLPFIQYGHTYTASGGIISQSISSLIPAITNTIGLSDRFQKTYSIGLRWDIYKGIALKFQADHMTSFKGTDGGFTSKPSKNPNLLSIAIDAVF